MYKHIIFDCFGTLIDTGAGSIEAVKKILNNVGCDVDEKVFYSEWKSLKKKLMLEETFFSEKDLFKISLGKMFDTYDINADASVEVKPMIDTLFGIRKVFPDVTETINTLDKMGIKYAIGSTTDTDSLMHFLSINNLNILCHLRNNLWVNTLSLNLSDILIIKISSNDIKETYCSGIIFIHCLNL